MSGKSYCIGLIVSDISNVFYAKIARSIERVLREQGYSVLVCSTDESAEREMQLVEMLVKRQQADGLIVASTLNGPGFYERPQLMSLPMVFIDRVITRLRANYVVVDNVGGAADVMRHLIWSGHTKIACLAITPIYLSTIEDRINGFYLALEKAGLPLEEIKEAGFDRIDEDVEKHLQRFLVSKNIPHAIFALNNTIAISLLKMLKKKEYDALRKIKIASFDDVELFNIVDMSVLSVSQPVEEMGEVAATKLLNMLSGRLIAPEVTVLPTKLIVR